MMNLSLNRMGEIFIQQTERELLASGGNVGITTSSTQGRRFDLSKGNVQAGLWLARLCTAGFGKTSYEQSTLDGRPVYYLQLETDSPVSALMLSQIAARGISDGSYFAMLSGPIRGAFTNDKYRKALDHPLEHNALRYVAVLEGTEPTEGACRKIVDKTLPEKLDGDREAAITARMAQLDIAFAPTNSLPGSAQVVCRTAETAMKWMLEDGFDVTKIKRARGRAPMTDLAPNPNTGIIWTNAASMYAGDAWLDVDATDDELQEIGPRLPMSAVPGGDKSFVEHFTAAGGDFAKMDPKLFRVARVSLTSTQTGHTFEYGDIRADLLWEAWKQKI